MNIYMSDKEQAQLLKEWWKKYGSTILMAILMFMAINLGWRYWQKYNIKQQDQVAVLYAQMFDAQAQNKQEELQLFADKLIKDYPRTAYASFAAMMLAKAAVTQNNLPVAEKNLLWVVDHARKDELRELARLRAARVLIAAGKAPEALKLLQAGSTALYSTAKNEIRGDALRMQKSGKSLQEAVANYRKALVVDTPASPLLQMKAEQLPHN